MAFMLEKLDVYQNAVDFADDRRRAAIEREKVESRE
jgi:hypothetical protein